MQRKALEEPENEYLDDFRTELTNKQKKYLISSKPNDDLIVKYNCGVATAKNLLDIHEELRYDTRDWNLELENHISART